MTNPTARRKASTGASPSSASTRRLLPPVRRTGRQVEIQRSAVEVTFGAQPANASSDLRPPRENRRLARSDAAGGSILVLPLSAAYAASRQVRHRSKDAVRRRRLA